MNGNPRPSGRGGGQLNPYFLVSSTPLIIPLYPSSGLRTV